MFLSKKVLIQVLNGGNETRGKTFTKNNEYTPKILKGTPQNILSVDIEIACFALKKERQLH